MSVNSPKLIFHLFNPNPNSNKCKINSGELTDKNRLVSPSVLFAGQTMPLWIWMWIWHGKLLMWSIVPMVTGQFVDTPTRGLPVCGLDNSRMPPAVAAIRIKYKPRTGRTGQSMNYGSLGCWVGMSHVMVRHCLPSTSLSPDTSQPNSRGLGRGLRQVSF